jgi:hypothetical protein
MKIVRAAVKIFDNRQHKEVIIPCHRHCDAFQILHDFGYKIGEFKTLAQGFLDEHDVFYDRVEAYDVAWYSDQLKTDDYMKGYAKRELFSEDLW